MTANHARPWIGMALALTGAIGMLLAGAGAWLTLAILLVWCGSLWLRAPDDPQPMPVTPTRADVRETIATVIEPIGFPLIMLEHDRIVCANHAARGALGGHIVGQDARIVLRHPEAMRLLELGPDESVSIPGFTGGRSLWQLTRRQIDGNRWLIEMLDRTAEADVSRAHTDFVANASHELRTPLAAIIGYVETLVEAGPKVDAGTSGRFLETVLREARRMQSLVADLMSLSQVEAEKHDLPSEEIDLARLAERVVGEVTAIAGKDKVIAIVPGEPVLLPGDRSQLEQMVRNLVENALKYGDGSEPVRVTLTPGETGRVVLTVADRGAGIAPEHIPHLTRRFYRTDPGRSRAAGGTGLGLAIVKHIVERHRGRLDIASQLGIGTTVTVSFASRARVTAR